MQTEPRFPQEQPDDTVFEGEMPVSAPPEEQTQSVEGLERDVRRHSQEGDFGDRDERIATRQGQEQADTDLEGTDELPH